MNSKSATADALVRIKNVHFRRVFWIMWPILSIAFGLTTSLLDRTGWASAGDNIADVAISIIIFWWALRLARFPEWQKYIEVSNEGIRYGPKQRLPWANVKNVSAIKPRLGRRHLVLTTQGWRPRGLFRGRATRRAPLSSFNSTVTPGDWITLLRRFGPEDLVLDENALSVVEPDRSADAI